MSTQKQQEIQEYLNELAAIVNLYNPKEGLWRAFALLSFQAICLIVILSIGLIWGLILLGLFFVPISCYLLRERSPKKSRPLNKELAERACIIMSSCINRYKYPEQEIYFLHYSEYESNLPLYKEFISIFPQMESKKLKRLSSIKLRG